MRIKCAAIHHLGDIHEGKTHAEIGIGMLKAHMCMNPFPCGDAQGFVTECGKFVTRKEAMVIAIAAGQVVEGETCHYENLFSEDLLQSNAAA